MIGTLTYCLFHLIVGAIVGALWGRFMPRWFYVYDHGYEEYVKPEKTCDDRVRDFWILIPLWQPALLIFGLRLLIQLLETVCEGCADFTKGEFVEKINQRVRKVVGC